jgi:asparagine synthase (glutamine-hydrolysing)
LAYAGVSRNVNVETGTRYLLGGDYDDGNDTMFQDVKQVGPAQFVRWDVAASSVVDVHRYWEPPVETTWKGTFIDAADCFREMLLSSVELHLRSDVPLGVALSGGLDSSALVCCMRHLCPDADVNTFSFIDDGEKSEIDWIHKIETAARTTPHHVSIGGGDFDETFDDFVLSFGEPVGGSSVFAHFKVAELTRESGVTVTLEGQGADELLGGYHGYSGLRLSEMLRKLEFHKALPFVFRASNWPGRNYRSVIRECLKDFGVSRGNNCQEVPVWLRGDRARDACLRRGIRTGTGIERLKSQLRFQLMELGLPGMMRHGDRTSMRVSIESRVPFLTRPLADFLYSLPAAFLVDDRGTSKSILRVAMRGIVPDEILDRRDKIGFATSEQSWMIRRQEWVREILSRTDAVSFINQNEVLAHWDRVVSGESRYTPLVWRWLNYVRWVELLSLSA